MSFALKYGILAILAVLVAVSPAFLSNHQLHVLTQIVLFAYLSSCWNILGGFAGQLSFGNALFMAVGAYGSTLLLLNFGVTPWVGMLAGGGLAILFGLGIGYLCFRYHIKGAFFALVTLAFTEIARIVALNTPALGGALGLYIPIQENDFLYMKFVDKEMYIYVFLALLVLVTAITAWLQHSRFGYRLVAIRENEEAAEASGINLLNYKLAATALSAFLTALGGSVYAHYVTFIDPHTLLNMNMAVEITIFAIVGGAGTLFGPIVGAAVLVPIAEFVRATLGQSYGGVHLVAYGAVLMAVMLYAPHGLIGLADKLKERLGRRPAPAAGTNAAKDAGSVGAQS